VSTPRALKQLERKAKGALLRVVGLALRGLRRRVVLDWSSAPRRVLFIRHDGIGDLLMSTPLLRAITRAHPNVSIDVLTFQGPADALRGLSFIRAVHVFRAGRRLTYPLDVMARIRRERYDAIIDGTVRRFVDGREFGGQVKGAMVLLLLASRARHRIGMAGRENDFVYTIPVHASNAQAHHSRYTASLGMPFGVDPSAIDTRPAMVLNTEERDEGERAWSPGGREGARLLVNISSLNECRRWDDDAYAVVLRGVRRQRPDVRIGIIGGPGDEARATVLARDVGAVAMVPPLRVAFGAVAAASVLLTPDTSMGHAAAALGTPVVVMLPTGHEPLVPAAVDGIHLFGQGGQIRSITADRVQRAVLDMLARVAPPSTVTASR
jgi:ADP-heptose:LPS heptosyltransferase